jgi:hypothetical protein
MKYLQAERLPFLMPVVMRGRKPKPGRKAKGLRVFRKKGVGVRRECRVSSAGISPARQLSFWPVATRVAVEMTKLSEPLVERSLLAIRESVGRNVSER